jgi:DNA-dependent RNA polymerase auxiliary subunit epsilon
MFSSSALEAELSLANNITDDILGHIEALDSKLMRLELDTKPVRSRTEALHLAQSSINAALKSVETVAFHFELADELSNSREGSTWDAESMIKISKSVEYLNEHKEFQSSDATITRLVEIKEAIRFSGASQVQTLLQRRGVLTDRDAADVRGILSVLLDTSGDDKMVSRQGIGGRVVSEREHQGCTCSSIHHLAYKAR